MTKFIFTVLLPALQAAVATVGGFALIFALTTGV